MTATVHAASVQLTIMLNVATDDLVQAIAAGMIGGPYGYAYWCDAVKVRNQPDLSAEQIAHHVLSGGVARVSEIEGRGDEGSAWHNLTRGKLLTGFGRWVVECGRNDTYDAGTGITSFDIDAPASDAILQLALFGEQRYG